MRWLDAVMCQLGFIRSSKWAKELVKIRVEHSSEWRKLDDENDRLREEISKLRADRDIKHQRRSAASRKGHATRRARRVEA